MTDHQGVGLVLDRFEFPTPMPKGTDFKNVCVMRCSTTGKEYVGKICRPRKSSQARQELEYYRTLNAFVRRHTVASLPESLLLPVSVVAYHSKMIVMLPKCVSDLHTAAMLATTARQSPVPAMRNVAHDVLSAMVFLEQRLGLVHRDIKPENILLDAFGRAILTDFGFVAPVVEAGCRAYVHDGRNAMGDIVLPAYGNARITFGTLDYASTDAHNVGLHYARSELCSLAYSILAVESYMTSRRALPWASGSSRGAKMFSANFRGW